MFAIWQKLSGHNDAQALIGYERNTTALIKRLRALASSGLQVFAINDEGFIYTVEAS